MNTVCYFPQQDDANIDERPASFTLFSDFITRNENFSEKVKIFSNHKHHLPTHFIIHVDAAAAAPPPAAAAAAAAPPAPAAAAAADPAMRPNNVIVHPAPDKTLERHFEILRVDQNIVPVMKYRGGYEYVPEEVRVIVKAIISALIYLHRRGGSFRGNLAWDNFVIFDSYLALRNLSISQTHTPQTRNSDFRKAGGFIRNQIFRGYKHRIPLDMQDLLHTLQSYEDSKKKLVAYHFATMSHSERIYFMKNCSDKRNMMIAYYKNAIRAIKKMPTNINEEAEMWGKLMEKSVFTEMVKSYKKVEYYVDSKNAYLSNENAIRCCRNLATHLGDENRHLKDRDIDIMISSIFAPILVSFADKLNNRADALLHVITWMEGV